MVCTVCGGKLINTDTVRNFDDNESYRRKRCLECGHILYTIEFEAERDEHYRKLWTKYHRLEGKRRKENGMQ